MSRFSKLEFDSGADNTLRREPEPAARDGAYHMLDAQSAFEAGDFERALRSYARVLEDNPKNPVPWTGQVRMLIELDEFREAKLWADKALEQFPAEPELLAAKAVALGRTGDLQAALAFSDASFEERGHTPYLWIARGDVLLARNDGLGDYCFEKAIQLEPVNWFFRWLTARVYFHYGRFVLAAKSLQEGLALDASCAVLWLQLGLCQRRLGLLPAAAGSIARAVELDPRHRPAGTELLQDSGTGFLRQFQARLRHLFSK